VARRLVSVAVLAFVVAARPAGASTPFPHFGTGCARADFTSAAVRIRAERCGPASGPVAAIVLHGCGGFSTFDHRLAADLPGLGIATLYVDYFAPTPPPGTRGYCFLWTRGRSLFTTWEKVAADAATSLRRHYRHVAAVGWSLGAGVAIAAAEDHRSFDAVAAFSALAYPSVLDRARLLPPSLFLSGGSRDIVSPTNARLLYAAAKRAHVRSALYVYPNGTHGWPGRQGQIGRVRAARFLLGALR
jgi:dienelactone hydrolase